MKFLERLSFQQKTPKSDVGFYKQTIIDIGMKHIDISRIIYVGQIHKISNLQIYCVMFETGVEITVNEQEYQRQTLINQWKTLN